jgi:phosphatidylserine synthase
MSSPWPTVAVVLAAIFFAMNYVCDGRPGAIYGAARLIAGALVFDVMDGRIAR